MDDSGTKSDANSVGKMEVYAKEVMRCVAVCTRLSNSIPGGSDFSLYSSYPAFKQIVTQHAAKCRQIMGRLSRKMKIRPLVSAGGAGSGAGAGVEEQVDWLIDTNDQLLEQINIDLDIMSGLRRSNQTVICSVNSAMKTASIGERWNTTTNRNEVAPSSGRAVRLLAAENVERPQLSFRRRVDNSGAPFVPHITDKPHALKPLAILLEKYGPDEERYSHPYEFELEKFTPADHFLTAPSAVTLTSTSDAPAAAAAADLSGAASDTLDSSAMDTSHSAAVTSSDPAVTYSDPVVTSADPTVSSSDPVPPVTIVDSPAGLRQLVTDLGQVTELAVDVEHHNYRSYMGLTCLIQISTRARDYIVDALALRDQLQPLNTIFTNPAIVKVLHGADMDVLWLQRDCALYIVHLFDTHQAARALSLPRLSLAYLLHHFCRVQPDKRLQLADWRIRPLPEEMVRYAQQDTHYLLFIYDQLRHLLVTQGNEQNNLMLSVYTNSTQICLKRYEKPRLTATSHLELYTRSRKSFNNRQMAALRHIYCWRDTLARDMDESTHYVLPNHMLLHIAEVLPREVQGLLACCAPVPPLVRQNMHQLHQIIVAARKLPPTHTSVEAAAAAAAVGGADAALPAQSVTLRRRRVYDPDSLLNCVHDLGHDGTPSPGQVTPLLDRPVASESAEAENQGSADGSRLVSFKTQPQLCFSHSAQVYGDNVSLDWISPYQRYAMLINKQVDEKGHRYMQELSECTAAASRMATGKRANRGSDSSDSDQQEEHVEGADLLPLQPPAAPAAAADQDTVSKRLRLSRADKIREMKANNTYKKPKRQKKVKSRQAVSNEVKRESVGEGEGRQSEGEAPFYDYERVSYESLMAASQNRSQTSVAKRPKPAGGSSSQPRVRQKRVRRAGKFQVFGAGSSR